MNTAANIAEQFGHRSRFLAVLVAAELNAKGEWEVDFVNDLRQRFEQHDTRMLLSNLQRKQLCRIAGEF